MKKAYVNKLTNEIIGHCFLPENLGIDYDIENTEIIEFDETLIDADYLKATLIDDVWTIEENTDKKNDDANVRLELRKMQYGQEVLAYIGVMFNALEVSQYQSLLTDNEIIMIQNLLGQGALESCHELLMSYTPNSIITQLILDKVQLKIQHYINQLS